LNFTIQLHEKLPNTIYTDAKRLYQVLKNLLSNAFKFTDHGEVRLEISPAFSGWNSNNVILNQASSVIAFSVKDTGIGIAANKQQVIFEAFSRQMVLQVVDTAVQAWVCLLAAKSPDYLVAKFPWLVALITAAHLHSTCRRLM
jgi:K+-sensing histidine kinase KdpD